MAEEVLLVRSIGALESIQDIEQLVVKVHNGITITLGQIAQVKIQEIYRNGAVTQNGNSEAVQGIIVALKGANARQLIMDVEERLDELSVALPKGTEISVFYNRSDLINTAVGSVSKALLEAVALVMIILLLFLGNLRAALAVAVILPLAALMTFILMRWFDLSANLMSLGGLAIAIGIGILVDAAVVIVENIVAQQERALNQPRMTRLHVIFRALMEVAVPVISGILIIIVVFLPLLTLEGIEGKLFTPVAVTIILALAS